MSGETNGCQWKGLADLASEEVYWSSFMLQGCNTVDEKAQDPQFATK